MLKNKMLCNQRLSMVDIRIEKDSKVGDKIDAPCSRCRSHTKHSILSNIELTGRDATEDYLIYGWDDSYQIIQCLGCETISFKKEHQNSEDEVQWEGPDGWESAYRLTQEYFPNPERGREPVSDLKYLPPNLREIYTESLIALNSDQRVLAGIGIRAIIETVCKDKNSQGKNLELKIDNLVTIGVLTADGAAILHKLRVLGNRAAHEVEPHDATQLGLAFDVVDHLVTGVYILPRHAKAKFK